MRGDGGVGRGTLIALDDSTVHGEAALEHPAAILDAAVGDRERAAQRQRAFALGDAAYLLRTWHPETRPERLDLAEDDRRFTGLEILETTGGSPLRTQGTVRFRAEYTDADGPGSQTEHSEFQRIGGDWVYVDALGFS